MGKFDPGKKGCMCALIGSCQHEEGAGGPVGILCDYSAVCIWLYLVGPKVGLEKSREAVGSSYSAGHLGPMQG